MFSFFSLVFSKFKYVCILNWFLKEIPFSLAQSHIPQQQLKQIRELCSYILQRRKFQLDLLLFECRKENELKKKLKKSFIFKTCQEFLMFFIRFFVIFSKFNFLYTHNLRARERTEQKNLFGIHNLKLELCWFFLLLFNRNKFVRGIARSVVLWNENLSGKSKQK